MKSVLIIAAALAAAPAFAQAGPRPPASAAEPIDSDRLAAAAAAIDHIWPLGTYERMMRGSIDQIADEVMGSMFDMRMGDLAATEGASGKPLSAAEADMTLRQAMAKVDPNFDERMRITNRVMMEELIPLMARLEPGIRAGLTRAYARKFTAGQLGEMNRFFASPAGGAYARESMVVWGDPEVVHAMGGFAPEMVKEMPRIMAKVEAATAHLPPLPRRDAPPHSD